MQASSPNNDASNNETSLQEEGPQISLKDFIGEDRKTKEAKPLEPVRTGHSTDDLSAKAQAASLAPYFFSLRYKEDRPRLTFVQQKHHGHVHVG